MTMTADEYLNEDIKEEFAKHSSVFRTARQLGVSLARVRDVVGEDDFHVEKKATQYGGRGRPELESHIVAIKNATEAWDNTSEELILCRARFEAGSHEMVQGRDGDNIIQYSIPRAVPKPNPGYFKNGAD